jgi:prepilin-type N-terminal cleavage/methylation domain-containing protein
MKSNNRSGKAAFTLIELMAVITIIVILAALVISGMGFVTERQAKEKAKIQIQLISKALEDYKLENGSYPGSANTSDGTGQSSILFDALFLGYTADGNAPIGTDASNPPKVYIADLDPVTNKQGWTSGKATKDTKIVDPWGHEYRYRSALSAAGAGATAQPNNSTINPDFDIWSAGKDGKSKPESKDDKSNNDDIKNF